MFSDLTVFRLAHARAVHAGQRQAIIAGNIANADTPGYRARDIAPFETAFRDGPVAMRASRTTHLNGADGARLRWAATAPQTPADPNGNGVSLPFEMLKGVEAKRQHDRALAIYRSALGILRTSLGRA